MVDESQEGIAGTCKHLTARPLRSKHDLQEALRRSAQCVPTTFTQVDHTRYSAQVPLFPTLTRFRHLKLIEDARFIQPQVRTSANVLQGYAIANLWFPIELEVTDGQRRSLEQDSPSSTFPDADGYPLFFESTRPLKTIPIRSTAALYNERSRGSPAVAYRMTRDLGQVPPSLESTTETQSAKSHDDGPFRTAANNHISLLLKAYLAYFDSIAASLHGAFPTRVPSSGTGYVVNSVTQKNWAKSQATLSKQIVNVRGEPRDYQEFWAYCCFNRPPIRATFRQNGVTFTTDFSHYEMSVSIAASMVCICDFDAFSPRLTPAFFGDPEAILTHIERYVQRHNIQQQANEALQVAMLWPTFCSINAPVSLPAPLLSALGEAKSSNIEAALVSAETSFGGLLSSSPFLLLASTVSAAAALWSQLFDYVLLISEKAIKLDWQDFERSARWLQAEMTTSGSGWAFLLGTQFHSSPSILYLTGLTDHVIHWLPLLRRLYIAGPGPSHLRLLQAFWNPFSLQSCLPWHSTWWPDISLDHDSVTATFDTLQMLCELRILTTAHRLELDIAKSRHSLLTLTCEPRSLNLCRAAARNGVRLVARLRRCSVLEGMASSSTLPPDTVAGVLGKWKLQDMVSNALSAPIIKEDGRSVCPQALSAAATRVERVKQDLLEQAEIEEKKLREYLQVLAQNGFDRMQGTAQNAGETVFDPLAATAAHSGWLCLLWLTRLQRRDQHSLASLQRTVKDLVGEVMPSSFGLGTAEMTGLCRSLGLQISQISDDVECFKRTDESSETLPQLQCSAAGRWIISAEKKSSVYKDITDTFDKRLFQAAFEKRNPKPASAVTHGSIVSGSLHSLNLTTRARLIDQLIRLFDWKIVTQAEVCQRHQELFPTTSLPRFLTSEADVTVPTAVSFKDSSKATGNIIRSYLEEQIGAVPSQSLDKFRKSLSEDSEECQSRWPFRSKSTAFKNNITIFELLSFLSADCPQEALAISFVMKHEGNHGEYVTAVALWLSALSLCESAWEELLDSKLLHANEDDWLQVSSSLHERWRKRGLQHCRCNDCWVQLLYSSALWGRGGVEVDWSREISNKAKVPDPILAFTGQAWSESYASTTIQATIRDVVRTAKDRVQIKSFEDFMDYAYEWLVSGSAAGLPSAFRDTDIREILLKKYGLYPRPTKRSVMEKLPRQYIRAQLDTRPQIVAKLHQKLNETGGKARAIYGVTIWHYIFSNWLMAPLEQALNHPQIDLNLRNDKFVELFVRRAQGARRGAFFNSYDYPDFNGMHSHAHMAMIYEETVQMVQSTSEFAELQKSDQELILRGYAWLRESVFTQVCYLSQTNALIQTVGGLYSGNRDTTLINTILNIAYASVVDLSCRNMSLDPCVDWRLCHGDDIITQHSSYGAALAWNQVAAKANLRGQEHKLLTDRSYHEYLRVMGCPDGKLRGSLARAIASFVNGNWETETLTGLPARITELNTTLGTLSRRGLRPELLLRLRIATFRRAESRWSGEDAEAQEVRRLLRHISNPSDAEFSAIGPSLYEGTQEIADDHDLTVPLLRRKDDVERLFLDLPDEVTRPYIKRLISSLPRDLPHPQDLVTKLKLMFQKSTYGTELPVRYQLDTEQLPQLRHIADLAKRKADRSGKDIVEIEMETVDAIVRQNRTLTTAIRRIKAAHIMLAVFSDLGSYTRTGLVAALADVPESAAADALAALQLTKSDWRRYCRPSAPEVGSLENELETILTKAGSLHHGQEVLVMADNGAFVRIPVRDMMLY